jgi:hypothetical protein
VRLLPSRLLAGAAAALHAALLLHWAVVCKR